MPGNGLDTRIPREVFRAYTTDEKLDLIYSAVVGMGERLRELERRSWVKSLYAFVGGMIGGFLAFIGFRWRG